MKYYLGIDGGGTKTRFLLSDEKLNILAEYNGGSCHYLQIGFDGLEKLIREGIDRVCKTAGIGQEQISSAFAGLAGYHDTKKFQKPIEDAVSDGMDGIRYELDNDSANALTGALGGEPGINIIAGTGSIAAARAADGHIERCGGGLYVIGSDEGSAYWIAIKMYHEFTKQSDGRHARTILYDKMCEVLGVSDKQDLITVIIDEMKLDRDKIAEIAPLCAELYDAGDPWAISIIQQSAEEFTEMSVALYKRIGFTGNIKVSGTGGVFKLGARLTDLLTARLSENNMTFVEPLYDPGTGALILAKEID